MLKEEFPSSTFNLEKLPAPLQLHCSVWRVSFDSSTSARKEAEGSSIMARNEHETSLQMTSIQRAINMYNSNIPLNHQYHEGSLLTRLESITHKKSPTIGANEGKKPETLRYETQEHTKLSAEQNPQVRQNEETLPLEILPPCMGQVPLSVLTSMELRPEFRIKLVWCSKLALNTYDFT